MKTFDFGRCLRLGAKGAEWVVRALNERDVGITLTDDEQHRGVDGISPQWGRVEIKVDFHDRSPNVFLEVEVDGKPGAIFTSRADVLIYAFPRTGDIYIFPMAWVQYWLAIHLGELKRQGAVREIHTRNHSREWQATGVVVPRSRLTAEAHGTYYHSEVKWDE